MFEQGDCVNGMITPLFKLSLTIAEILHGIYHIISIMFDYCRDFQIVPLEGPAEREPACKRDS